MLKGLQYYSDDPGKAGETFIRLEHDFDLHVDFCRELPHLRKLVDEKESPIGEFLQVILRFFFQKSLLKFRKFSKRIEPMKRSKVLTSI